MEQTAAKPLFAAVLGVLAYLRGALNELFVVLALLMLADYAIGVAGALVQGEFTVRRGVRGAVKKACYLILVAVGFLLDYAVHVIASGTGIVLETNGMFGYTILCYLIGTEGLSCLRGLSRMGVRIPAFFLKGFGMLKTAAQPEEPEQDAQPEEPEQGRTQQAAQPLAEPPQDPAKAAGCEDLGGQAK